MSEDQAGATSAELFVRRLSADHGDALFGWAVSRFSDQRDAEEVVAETLVRAWRHHDQYDPERGAERSWVFAIARNVAVDHFRRGRRHLRVVSDEDRQAATEVEAPTDRIADSTLVRDGLLSLTEPHREALVLAYFGGLSVAEMSARLGIPPGTVKSRLYYAMRSLRAALEERGLVQ